jgi:formylglycine-generating enzyme required for sulfatase activity
MNRILIGIVMGSVSLLSLSALAETTVKSGNSRNEELLQRINKWYQLTSSQDSSLRAIFLKSEYIGQGNPAVTVHPIDKKTCEQNMQQTGITHENAEFTKICGSRFMAPLYNPATQKVTSATTCMDQFEFPNIPCEYPVVWVRAREAALICTALGKRLCDTHEWEGGCEGALLPPDYPYGQRTNSTPSEQLQKMRNVHNQTEQQHKTWSYGTAYEKGICATASTKTKGCNGGSYNNCGSNTYPAGSFSKCKSTLGFYDMNGNAAEHMNIPLNDNQLSSLGSRSLGYTEMKGSWFIFDTFRAHEDYCRWRAPFWHGSRVMDTDSHRNYHLGFRCCKTIGS